MNIESFSDKQIKKRIYGFSAAAVISAGVAAGGIYGWVKQTENPLSQSCRALTSESLDLETKLFNEGTLGADGGLILNRYLEIRNPDDPRLKDLGQFKNQRDHVCADSRAADQASNAPWVRMGAIGGVVISIACLTNALSFGKLLNKRTV